MAASTFRVGIRVADVAVANRFYTELGFEQVATIPDSNDHPVMTILRLGDTNLMVDALVGMPFPDTERERQIQRGPRGLGVALGLEVDDLAAYYDHCRSWSCTITSDPTDEPWGARVFECIDPFGYVWEFSQPIENKLTTDAVSDTHASWFGGSGQSTQEKY